jgi:hypothetical protein
MFEDGFLEDSETMSFNEMDKAFYYYDYVRGAGNAGAGNAPAKERKSVPPAMVPSDLDILPRMRR